MLREGSSSQFRPNITSRKAWGSELNRDWRSGLRRDRLRNWERAGQWHTKCTWSSGPEPHSLQVGSRLDKVELRLDELKRQTSYSRPWHPTSRRILKLFNLVSFGSPRVTNQCGMGLPSLMSSHSESGRREQSFRKLEYSFASVSFLTNLFHASLLQLSLRMEYSDGRLFFRVGMMPLEGVLEIRDARTWRGSELEGRTEKE